MLLRRRASKKNPLNLAACQDFFFDTFSPSSGGDDEVATIAMKLQTSFGSSYRLDLVARVVKVQKHSVVVEHQQPEQKLNMSYPEKPSEKPSGGLRPEQKESINGFSEK